MDAAIRAIAEPRRRAILNLIRRRELSAGQIASHFDVTRPAISQHIGVLKRARLVTERRAGTRRLYGVRLEGLQGLRDYLEGFWYARLVLLKRAAETGERRRERMHGRTLSTRQVSANSRGE